MVRADRDSGWVNERTARRSLCGPVKMAYTRRRWGEASRIGLEEARLRGGPARGGRRRNLAKNEDERDRNENCGKLGHQLIQKYGHRLEQRMGSMSVNDRGE